MGRVIALANQKGGVAKTTSTLNLAVAFAEEGNRVLAIDLDPQGNLTMSQGLNPDTIERSMYDVLVHKLPLEQILHHGEIDLGVASIDLAGAELALSSMIGRERALEKALAPVRPAYDFVVIDTPPSLGLLTINALVAATGVIVPVQCEYLSLRGLVQLENTLSMIRENLNPDTIERSMYDVLVHRLPIEQIIHRGEIDLAVASIDLAGAELALSAMIGRERSLEKALQPVLERYDFVVIDTPPSLGLLTINALVASNGVIVPVQCEYLSLRGLVQLENTLSMIRENLNPDVGIEGILATMYDSRTLHSREALEILEENFGDLVFKTRIRKTIRYAEAPVKGTSVLKYDPTGSAAQAYRDLAKEVLNGAQARKHA
ncbi:MAG TPA: AAA family ATPase [Gaiellaceae bacterium]